MIALIDLDVLPYMYGGLTYDDVHPMPDKLITDLVAAKIDDIVTRSGSDSWIGYLSDSKSNFRNQVSTILPYKGHRAGPKPAKYQMIRDWLQDEYPDQVEMIYDMEADDAISIHQMKDFIPRYYENTGDGNRVGHPNWLKTIICTIDKDLEMVPGWHYKWSKGKTEETPPFFVSETEGLRFFYKQLLTGDMTDNIRGLYGVGPKSTLLSKLDDMTTEKEMFIHVYAQYENRFGTYAEQFMKENGVLLWMKRTVDDDWTPPMHYTIKKAEVYEF